jgi:hypothetical protein
MLSHRHVRVERVVLEHHGDVAVLGRHVVDHAVADGDLAAGDLLEPGDHAQQRGLAAARRADQHDELAVLDVEADVFHGGDILALVAFVDLENIAQRDFGHAVLSDSGFWGVPGYLSHRMGGRGGCR